MYSDFFCMSLYYAFLFVCLFTVTYLYIASQKFFMAWIRSGNKLLRTECQKREHLLKEILVHEGVWRASKKKCPLTGLSAFMQASWSKISFSCQEWPPPSLSMDIYNLCCAIYPSRFNGGGISMAFKEVWLVCEGIHHKEAKMCS